MIETKKSCCDTPYSYSETQQEEERRSCWPDKRTEYREYTCDLFSDTAEHKLRSMIKTQSRPSALYIEESQPFFADRFYWHDPISSTVQRHSQRMSPYEGRWRHWMNSHFFFASVDQKPEQAGFDDVSWKWQVTIGACPTQKHFYLDGIVEWTVD